MNTIIIGCDGGLANMGLAIVELLPAGERVIDLATFTTEKSDAKQNVYASDDLVRRAQQLNVELRNRVALATAATPIAICSESLSYPRSSVAVAMLGMAWGLVVAASRDWDAPIVQASPQRIKKVLCGKKNATKDGVQAALNERYGAGADLFASFNKGKREHAADALGAIVACLDSPVVAMARRMAA